MTFPSQPGKVFLLTNAHCLYHSNGLPKDVTFTAEWGAVGSYRVTHTTTAVHTTSFNIPDNCVCSQTFFTPSFRDEGDYALCATDLPQAYGNLGAREVAPWPYTVASLGPGVIQSGGYGTSPFPQSYPWQVSLTYMASCPNANYFGPNVIPPTLVLPQPSSAGPGNSGSPAWLSSSPAVVGIVFGGLDPQTPHECGQMLTFTPPVIQDLNNMATHLVNDCDQPSRRHLLQCSLSPTPTPPPTTTPEPTPPPTTTPRPTPPPTTTPEPTPPPTTTPEPTPPPTPPPTTTVAPCPGGQIENGQCLGASVGNDFGVIFPTK